MCVAVYRSAALFVICDSRANYSQLHMSFADDRVAKETGAAAIFAVLIVIVPAAYLTMRYFQRHSAKKQQREQDAGDMLLSTPPAHAPRFACRAPYRVSGKFDCVR
jgi:peptidoglycan/LPS O-acetylase OafA/YrhL